jgi:thiopurine S-methyltransferase
VIHSEGGENATRSQVNVAALGHRRKPKEPQRKIPISHQEYGADFWHSRWERGAGPFSAGTQGDLMGTHWPTLGVAPASRVLVPLAGKSPDLAWLAGHGFNVVGVELSPIACEGFFTERHLAVRRIPDGPFVRWEGGGVTILQGDFFDLRGTFDAALDRGALVTFPQATRRRYVQHLKARLIADAAVLLVTIEYDASRRTGPPFPVFPQEVGDLYPGAIERARHQLRRPRWEAVGGAEVVLWTARIVNASPTTT